MTELLPCQFCGSCEAPRVEEVTNVQHIACGNYRVVCDFTRGGCGASSGSRRSKAEAIDAWNTRASETQLLAEMQTRVWIAERQRNEAMAALADEGIKLPRERTCRNNAPEYLDRD